MYELAVKDMLWESFRNSEVLNIYIYIYIYIYNVNMKEVTYWKLFKIYWITRGINRVLNCVYENIDSIDYGISRDITGWRL